MDFSIVLFSVLAITSVLCDTDPCINQPNGKTFLYKAPRIYLTCYGQEPYVMWCELDEEYDVGKENCTKIETSDLKTNLTNSNTKRNDNKFIIKGSKFCKNLPYGTKLPYSINCREYYFCHQNFTELKHCFDNAYYSSRNERCAIGAESECDTIFSTNVCNWIPDGEMIPHPQDLSKFLICYAGMAFERFCPLGLHFSSTSLMCRWPDPENQNTCKNNHGLAFPNPQNCSEFYLCSNEKMIPKKCAENLHYSAKDRFCKSPELAECKPDYNIKIIPTTTQLLPTTSTTTTQNPNNLENNITNHYNGAKPDPLKFCKNLNDGILLPYSKNCNEFYFCIEDTAYLKRCPSPLFYNSRIEYCTVEAEAECNKQIEANICKQIEDGGMLSHPQLPQNCDKFAMCISGKAFERYCATGLHFSLKDSVCTWPEDAGCETLDLCNVETHGELFPNPRNCSKYYLCFYEEARPNICPNGLHFSPTQKYCMLPELAGCDPDYKSTTIKSITTATENPLPKSSKTASHTSTTKSNYAQFEYCKNLPDGILLPYSNNCNEFFLCVANVAQLKRCPPKLYYSSRDEYCVREERAECNKIVPLNICNELPDGRMLPYPDDCEKFLICVFGQSIEKFCPNGLHFSPKNSVCTWPDDAGCETIGLCTEQPHGEVLPHPRNCSKYYLCFYEEARSEDCPNGLHFSSVAKYCMLPELAGCDPIYNTTTTSSTITTTESTTPVTTSTSTPLPPVPTTSTSKEPPPTSTTTSTTTSATTTTKSPIPGSCKGLRLGTHIKHPNDCTKYIVCIGGGVVMNCPKPLEFNSQEQVCDWPERAECS